MIWQDIIIAIANLLFTISLITQVSYGFKRRKGLLTLPTAGLTTIGLYAISICFFTLGLLISGFVSGFNATLWLTLFIQRIVFQKA